MNVVIMFIFPVILCIVDACWQKFGDIDHIELFSTVVTAWVLAWAGCIFVHVLYTARTAFELAF